jgi:hypothetical protein
VGPLAGFEPKPEEVFAWRRERALLRPVAIHVRNVGQVVASDVGVELTVKKEGSLRVYDEDNIPARPRGVLQVVSPLVSQRLWVAPDVHIKDLDDHWLIALRLGKIQPGGGAWSDTLYFGSAVSPPAA